MNVSHARVHAVVEDAPNNGGDNANAPPRVRMKEIQGMAGTPGGLSLRLLQFVLAAAALLLMPSIIDFPPVTAFRCLVAAAGLQSLWSLSLAITDAYAILVMRSLQNYQLVSFFTAGDWVTSTLTFGAACASAGITVDAGSCSQLHCETAIQMAFTCWFTTVPSFFLSFWSLAYR